MSGDLAENLSPGYEQMLVIGLGLLGGSVALAAREKGLAHRISALSRPGAPHDRAKAAGLIDSFSEDLEASVAAADFILLAQPVEAIRKIIPAVLKSAKPGAIITDVGSTKSVLVAAAETVSTPAFFVGSHPMAGSHVTGWDQGRADLFHSATTYVTVTEKTDLSAAARVALFWETLGARVIITHPKRHDELAALVSHIPHLAAVGLMQFLAASGEDTHLLQLASGPGLRDTTRIAMGSAQIWSEICAHNAGPIAERLSSVAAELESIAELVRKGDAKKLSAVLEEAAEMRKKF
ncbi:prephenate dehydrogenase [soil metagenome]